MHSRCTKSPTLYRANKIAWFYTVLSLGHINYENTFMLKSKLVRTIIINNYTNFLFSSYEKLRFRINFKSFHFEPFDDPFNPINFLLLVSRYNIRWFPYFRLISRTRFIAKEILWICVLHKIIGCDPWYEQKIHWLLFIVNLIGHIVPSPFVVWNKLVIRT